MQLQEEGAAAANTALALQLVQSVADEDTLQVKQVLEHCAQEPASGLAKYPASHTHVAGAVAER